VALGEAADHCGFWLLSLVATALHGFINERPVNRSVPVKVETCAARRLLGSRLCHGPAA